jgi:hypothetical protein
MTRRTAAEVMAELGRDTPLNNARKKFSSFWAQIEQYVSQSAISPVEIRRLELEAVEAIAAELNRWQDPSTAPKDGTKILIWCAGEEWPEAAFWEDYHPDVVEEVGAAGYWRYADSLLADICEAINPIGWMPMPEKPRIG